MVHLRNPDRVRPGHEAVSAPLGREPQARLQIHHTGQPSSIYGVRRSKFKKIQNLKNSKAQTKSSLLSLKLRLEKNCRKKVSWSRNIFFLFEKMQSPISLSRFLVMLPLCNLLRVTFKDKLKGQIFTYSLFS